IARDLALDGTRLAAKRQRLRQRMQTHLCDGAAFTLGLEDVYRTMWHEWCRTVRDNRSIPTTSAKPEPAPTELNQQGLQLAHEGRFEEAADRFSRAIAQHPDHGSAWLNLGMSLRNLGRYDRAINAYQELLRITPRDPAVHSNLAAAYQQI